MNALIVPKIYYTTISTTYDYLRNKNSNHVKYPDNKST